jgi:hypothetical protein
MTGMGGYVLGRAGLFRSACVDCNCENPREGLKYTPLFPSYPPRWPSIRVKLKATEQ